MALTAPPANEVLDFQFKLHCRLKIFNNEDNAVFGKPCSLVAAASRYGLVFVGTASSSFQVLSLENLEQIAEKKSDVTDFLKRTVNLPSQPTHLSANCDCTLLCVVVEKQSCITALIYNISSFATQDVAVIQEIRLSATAGVFVVEVSWNPTIPGVLTVCKSDGSLGLYEFKGSGIDINEIPPASGSTCMCWSPKGKQLAVGSVDGKITQYKPDLKPVKAINAPQLEGGCTVLALQWVSNYQFIAIYGSTAPESRANLVVVDAPKTGETKYTNYEDICYSYGSTRPVQFYMMLQPIWNVLMVASSNSMEVGILGLSKEQQWTQWSLGDAARAELPLSPKKQDTLPVGLAVDVGTKTNMPWGETTLPPAPFLYLMSHHGVLCCFHIVNIREGAAPICQAPETLPENNGLKYFTKESTVQTQNVAAELPVVQQQQPLQSQEQQQQQLQQPPMLKQLQQYQVQMQQQLQQQLLQQQLQQQQQQALPQQQQALPQQSQFSTPKPKQSLFGTAKSMYDSPQLFGTAAKTLFNSPQQTPQISAPQPIKAEVKPVVSVPPTATAESVPSTPKIDAETEKLLSKMIREECVSLESEIKALLHKSQTLKITLGSDTESTELVKNADDLNVFLEKLTETSVAQAAEIHTLKQKLLQSWAWFEDARSRFAVSKDPAMAALIRTQLLDPASQQHLDDLKHLLYYIESQLVQANNTLDEQWENFQDSCKKIYKVQLPTMETIYQAMVRQTATVQKQSYILKDIGARLRKQNSTHASIALLATLENADEVVEKLKSLQLRPQDLMQVEYERVLKKQKQLSENKVEQLAEFFSKHKPRVVRVIKPKVAPLKLSPQKSILESNVSPVVPKAKELMPRMLDLTQSAPKSFTPASPTATPPSTPLSGVQSKPFEFNSRAFYESKPSGLFGSAFAATTQPLTTKPTITPVTTAKPTTPISTPSSGFANISTTKSSMSFTPATSEPTKFSFATIPTATTTDANFRYASGNVPTTQMAIFATGTNTVVSSPGIIKPTAKAAVAPLTTFMQSGQAATQGSMFAKPNISLGSKAFEVMQKPAAVVSSSAQVPGSGFSFAATATANKSTSSASVATPQTTATTASIFGGQAQLKAALSLGTTTSSSFFGAETPSIFASAAAAATTTTTSIFSSAATTSSTASTTKPADTKNIFGTAVSSMFGNVQSAPTTTTANILGGTTATGSLFGATAPATTTSLFGTAQTQSKTSIFAAVTTAPAPTTAASVAASTTATTSTTTSVASTAAATTARIFGAAISTATTVSSLFGSAQTTATTPGLLGSVTSPSIFGSTTTTAAAQSGFGTTPATTSTSSVFGNAAKATTASVFGVTTTTTTSTPTATTASLFGAAPATTGGVFGAGAPATSSIFGGAAATTTGSIFGSVATTTTASSAFDAAATTASLFGATATATTASGVLGAAATTTASLFGSTATTTTASSFFGAAGTKASLFGAAATTTTASSFFGAAGTTTSLFGATATTTTASSVFGVATTTASLFGSIATTTTASSVFGAAATTATSNVFGVASTTTTASTFGSPPATTSSIFGTPATTTTSIFGGGSAFGSTAFGQTSPVFGATTTTTSAPAFGSSPVFASTAPAFGNTTAQPAFGSGSIFGTPASTSGSIFGGAQTGFGKPATAAPPFGAAATSAPAFGTAASTFSFANAAANVPNTNTAFGFNKSATGSSGEGAFSFGSLNVGTTTAASTGFGGGFGQAQTANPFGRTDAAKPAFGSSSGSIFGSPAATSAGSGFGAASTFGSPAFGGGGAAFGSAPAFGQSSFGQSGFSGSTFGSPSQNSGPFSGGGQSVGQTGFGSGGFQSSPGGFGGPPVFGAGSGFGAAPAFGGAPAFGSAATFNSPGKSFGSSTFGSTGTQQNPTFGNLATQNTLGFGSLAQQGQPPAPPQQTAFGGGSSFSSWR